MQQVNETSLNITTSENSLDSITNWVEQHQHFLYSFGLSYLGNQQLTEELFYKAILKMYKEFPRYKHNMNFKSWVIANFLQTCRELEKTNTEVEEHAFLKAIQQLNQTEKEAAILTYINDFTHEEVAQILQLSKENVKEHLHSAIQSLRKAFGYGSNFNGCKEYQKDYIDYLGHSMERSNKIEFETHFYHCESCQEDLGTFQDVTIQLSEWRNVFKMPEGFLKKIKERIAEHEKEKHKKLKKRSIFIFSLTGVFVLFISYGILSGMFSKFYYTWTENNEEVLAYVQNDLGEMLNLEAESNGVKITIKTAVADEFQTLILYEIEDTEENNQYMMAYEDGVYVENQYEILNMSIYPTYHPPFLDEKESGDEQNVYQGKLSLPPLKEDSGTIKLNISSLQKVIDYNEAMTHGGFEMEYKEGEWNFEIPVTMKSSKEYALDKEVEIEGIPFRFEQLIVAPTTTMLRYSVYRAEQNQEHLNVNFDQLRLNDEKLNQKLYSSSFVDFQLDMNWTTFQTSFEPFFKEGIHDVVIQFKNIDIVDYETMMLELDFSKEFPYTFEYGESTFTVDKKEEGQWTNIIITNEDYKDGNLDDIFIGPYDAEGYVDNFDMHFDTVLVDKEGNEVALEEIDYYSDEMENYRYVTRSYELRFENIDPEKNLKIRLDGFRKTIYSDEIVEISL